MNVIEFPTVVKHKKTTKNIIDPDRQIAKSNYLPRRKESIVPVKHLSTDRQFSRNISI